VRRAPTADDQGAVIDFLNVAFPVAVIALVVVLLLLELRRTRRRGD
jgi:hypothetical protein